MSSTPGESEALGRLVEPWAVKIAKSSGVTVEAIVTNAENVRTALQELKPHGRKARQLLAERSGLSRTMLSKLEPQAGTQACCATGRRAFRLR